MERFEDRSDGEPPAPNGKKRNQKNAPRFDVQGQLYRMTGVDLTRIDGMDGFTALKVVSEIGTGMTKWPSAKHFASWLVAESQQPHHRRPGHQLEDQTQRQPGRARHCVWRPTRCTAPTAPWAPSCAGRKSHLGAPKAITATAHKLARSSTTMLRYGQGVRGCWRGILRTAVSSAGLAHRQASGGTTGLPVGA